MFLFLKVQGCSSKPEKCLAFDDSIHGWRTWKWTTAKVPFQLLAKAAAHDLPRVSIAEKTTGLVTSSPPVASFSGDPIQFNQVSKQLCLTGAKQIGNFRE